MTLNANSDSMGAPHTSGNSRSSAASRLIQEEEAKRNRQRDNDRRAREGSGTSDNSDGSNRRPTSDYGETVSLEEVFGVFSRPAASLSEEGERFRERLIQCTEDPTRFNLSCKPLQIINLPTVGGLALVRDGFAYILIFHEIAKNSNALRVHIKDNRTYDFHNDPMAGLRPDSFIMPTACVAKDAVDALAEQDSSLTVVSDSVVHPSDYEKVTSIVRHAALHIDSLSRDAGFDFETLRDRSNSNRVFMTVQSTMSVVLSEYRNYTPHGIMPRSDFGLVIDIHYGPMKNNSGIPENKIPVAVVTGYTDFYVDERGMRSAALMNQQVHPGMGMSMMGTGHQRHIHPVVHISEIIIPSNIFALVPIALTVSANTFAAGWRNAYYDTAKYNIGNLMIGENDKPDSVKDTKEAISFIEYNVGLPLVAVDYVKGRCNPVTLELLAEDSRKATCLYYDAIGVSHEYHPEDLTVNSCVEYIGFYTSKQELVDSRHCDYLTVLKEGHSLEKARIIRDRYDPVVRDAAIRDLHRDLETVYVNTVCFLNGNVLRALHERIYKVVSIYDNGNSHSSFNAAFADIGGMVSSMQAFYAGHHAHAAASMYSGIDNRTSSPYGGGGRHIYDRHYR